MDEVRSHDSTIFKACPLCVKNQLIDQYNSAVTALSHKRMTLVGSESSDGFMNRRCMIAAAPRHRKPPRVNLETVHDQLKDLAKKQATQSKRNEVKNDGANCWFRGIHQSPNPLPYSQLLFSKCPSAVLAAESNSRREFIFVWNFSVAFFVLR